MTGGKRTSLKTRKGRDLRGSLSKGPNERTELERASGGEEGKNNQPVENRNRNSRSQSESLEGGEKENDSGGAVLKQGAGEKIQRS